MFGREDIQVPKGYTNYSANIHKEAQASFIERLEAVQKQYGFSNKSDLVSYALETVVSIAEGGLIAMTPEEYENVLASNEPTRTTSPVTGLDVEDLAHVFSVALQPLVRAVEGITVVSTNGGGAGNERHKDDAIPNARRAQTLFSLTADKNDW